MSETTAFLIHKLLLKSLIWDLSLVSRDIIKCDLLDTYPTAWHNLGNAGALLIQIHSLILLMGILKF
jgi:hypothetical protein